MNQQYYRNLKRAYVVRTVTIGGIVIGLLAIVRAILNYRETWDALLVLFWALGPPIWFFVEYLCLFDNWEEPKAVTRFKDLQALAGKMWAAVAGVLILIYSGKMLGLSE